MRSIIENNGKKSNKKMPGCITVMRIWLAVIKIQCKKVLVFILFLFTGNVTLKIM